MPANVAALLASRAEAHSESPDKSVHTWNIITQTLCLVSMTIFFLLRVYSRVFLLNGFHGEDCESSWIPVEITIYQLADSLYRDLPGRLGKTLCHLKIKECFLQKLTGFWEWPIRQSH